MGLMQRAYETYCFMEEKYAGVYSANLREPLAPVAHAVTSAQIEITVDRNGEFVSASAVSKDETKIIIPVTESSLGRTSGVNAHPLCDQIGYLSGKDDKKYSLYVKQLTDWVNSEFTHPKLLPILQYVKGGTILADLLKAKLIQTEEGGSLSQQIEKMLVRWRVLDCGMPAECWKDRDLFHAFAEYYLAQKESDGVLCMVTGAAGAAAKQHPKGTVSSNGNAKLVSTNDTLGFTYRGRFVDDAEALTISYEASQKAHNALHWLVANWQVRVGKRVFLCWNPQGVRTEPVHAPLLRRREKPLIKASDYQKELQSELYRLKAELPPDALMIVAAFDAATSGRLALTYYSELPMGNFVERLHAWDSICCWNNGSFGIQSPSLFQIARCAYGIPRTVQQKTSFECDEKVFDQAVQRLITCRVDGAKLPGIFARNLMQKASNLLIINDSGTREMLLFTACAVIRKYHFDRDGEEIAMELDKERMDLSYQFGRLLAVLEKAERDTYNSDEKREPNAMRMQSEFTKRPLHTFRLISDQLKKAYYPRLSPAGRTFYEKLIGEIVEKIAAYSVEEQNRPLGDTYLVGYYLQKNSLYQSNKKQESTEE